MKLQRTLREIYYESANGQTSYLDLISGQVPLVIELTEEEKRAIIQEALAEQVLRDIDAYVLHQLAYEKDSDVALFLKDHNRESLAKCSAMFFRKLQSKSVAAEETVSQSVAAAMNHIRSGKLFPDF